MNFNFKENYILEDERVCLRPLEITDNDFLLNFSINEPEIWMFNARGAEGIENLKKYIATAIKQRQIEKEYAFIVYDKAKQKYAGSTRFYDMQLENKNIQLGYTWYGKEFQGTGINKHCKYLMLEFAFEKMNMERVEFRANSNNEKSINAMKSIGCTIEGILRNNTVNANGERSNGVVLSILREEWNTAVKSILKNKLL